jgi:hypothetical protein
LIPAAQKKADACVGFFIAAVCGSAGAEHHHGLAFDVD